MLDNLKKMFGFSYNKTPEKADQTAVDISVSRRRNEEAARRLMETVKGKNSDDELMPFKALVSKLK